MSILVLLRHGQSQWNLENRFTGWEDVPLTDLGRDEARRAGQLLRESGIPSRSPSPRSWCGRRRRSTSCSTELGAKDLPIERDQALNERHYGDLQGLNKAETAKKFGDEQVHIWRRSYDIAPPGGESLKDTAARTLPYFAARIAPQLQAGHNVLVAAHGNSLRSIVMDLEKLTREQVLELNIATGVPIVYELDGALSVVKKTILEWAAAPPVTPHPDAGGRAERAANAGGVADDAEVGPGEDLGLGSRFTATTRPARCMPTMWLNEPAHAEREVERPGTTLRPEMPIWSWRGSQPTSHTRRVAPTTPPSAAASSLATGTAVLAEPVADADDDRRLRRARCPRRARPSIASVRIRDDPPQRRRGRAATRCAPARDRRARERLEHARAQRDHLGTACATGSARPSARRTPA